MVDIGPGSPTGVAFGYGAKFPAKYQRALYICDWTDRRMYAVHLQPDGSTYGGTLEEFLSASPLPLTDVVIHPSDGHMYFLIGGRKVQSGLYRVTYRGEESTAPAASRAPGDEQRAIRRQLEAMHAKGADVELLWPHLGSSDRFIRHAARIALEHQHLKEWQRRALDETDPQIATTALIALARSFPRSYRPVGTELDTPPPAFPAPQELRSPLSDEALSSLNRIDGAQLTTDQRCDLLRAYELVLYRLGSPDETERMELITRLDELYPAEQREENVLITELLCYLQAPSAASKAMVLLKSAPTQEEQIDIARSHRFFLLYR